MLRNCQFYFAILKTYMKNRRFFNFKINARDISNILRKKYMQVTS